MCPVCYQAGGSLLHCLSTLTGASCAPAVYFCCTGLGVASTGRYPASCPVKPGLSSPDGHQLRSSVLPAAVYILTYFFFFVHAGSLYFPKKQLNGIESPKTAERLLHPCFPGLPLPANKQPPSTAVGTACHGTAALSSIFYSMDSGLNSDFTCSTSSFVALDAGT